MSEKINELKMNELKDMFFYTFGIVPLQNYGVIGDGMTDNRLKLQQAIYDAINVGAKYIFVPKGNYYYSQELFRTDEVAFIGNSIEAYIKDVEIKQFPGFNEQETTVQDNYSTDEIVIGKWIDGKPLYRKVIMQDMSNFELNNGTTIAHNISDVNEFIRRDIIICSGGAFHIFPYLANNTSGMRIDVNKTNISCVSWGGLHFPVDSSGYFKAILEYTKTAD